MTEIYIYMTKSCVPGGVKNTGFTLRDLRPVETLVAQSRSE